MVFGSDGLGGPTSQSDRSLTHALSQAMLNEHDIEDYVARVLLMVFGSDDLGGATSQLDSSLTHTLSKI